jgi:hypothetical protein
VIEIDDHETIEHVAARQALRTLLDRKFPP